MAEVARLPLRESAPILRLQRAKERHDRAAVELAAARRELEAACASCLEVGLRVSLDE